MGTEEKNQILSRIAVDLFAKSKGGEELSNKINRLRDEIKKVIESDDTVFGKFRGLVESLREIIPEEKKRYNAAIKALSTTSKISRQEIVKAVNNQLEELKILEKGLLGTSPGWRDEIKAMEAKSRETSNEISKLREIIGRLESEEKEILNGMATRKKEMELVEKAVGELFTVIAAEITLINKKVAEFSVESAAPQPIPPKTPQPIPIGDSTIDDILSDKKGGGQKNEIQGSSEPQNMELQKTCPMCGGQMSFYMKDNMKDEMWECYSCAYEELKEKKEGGEQKNEVRKPSAPQNTELQKICPMCGGRINFHIKEKMWMCYTCAYEESQEGEVQDTSDEKSEYTNAPKLTPASDQIFDPFPDIAAPSTSPSSSEYQESKKESSPSKKQPFFKKKNCPACHKKMNWHQDEGAWRCPFCHYERKI